MSATGDFTVSFYTDSAGTPGMLVTSFAAGNANQTSTGNLIAGSYAENSYSLNIPDLTLTAGSTGLVSAIPPTTMVLGNNFKWRGQ